MIIRRRAILTGTLVATALAAFPAIARARRLDAAGLDAALDAAFAAKAPVALAGGVVTHDGLVWSGARGVRQVETGDAATVQDRWHLGSNTKAMTAALYGRLVDQGRARWDAPVTEVFGAATADAGWSGTTMLDLMHHRAGLADAQVMGMPWLMTARGDPAPLTVQRARIAASALSQAPAGTKGQFAYGNANYVLVGAAIERITGGEWEDAMQAEVFGPLGLSSAGFGAPAHDVAGGGNAWGHRGAGTSLVAMDPASPGADNPAAMAPAGGVHMTLSDYADFLKVFLTEGGGWLKPETLAVLTTPPAEGEPYAAGWGVRPAARASGAVLGHDGSNTMWYVRASVAPGLGVAFVGLSNEGPQNGAVPFLVGGLRDVWA